MQILSLNSIAARTLKWFVHHGCCWLYSSTGGGAWRQVLCQSADTRQKNWVFNRIASPRKESDWLWHVVDAKVRAWIRFILSVHTPPNHPSTSNTKHIPTYAPHHLPPMNFSCLKGQAEGDKVLLAYQYQFSVQKAEVLACDLRWTNLRLSFFFSFFFF